MFLESMGDWTALSHEIRSTNGSFLWEQLPSIKPLYFFPFTKNFPFYTLFIFFSSFQTIYLFSLKNSSCQDVVYISIIQTQKVWKIKNDFHISKKLSRIVWTKVDCLKIWYQNNFLQYINIYFYIIYIDKVEISVC